jgi:hypothetical protein
MILIMKISHMIVSTSAPTPKNAPRNWRLLDVQHIGVRQPRQHENPGHHHEQDVGVPADDHQDGQHVEQHRQLELVRERIANLKRALRPGGLAQRHVLGADFAA